jgi:lipopolysaccharide transport system permease protein
VQNINTTFWQHRSLTYELVKREFAGRYRGLFGGLLWSLAEPLFMFAVYVIVFGFIMKARWSMSGDAKEYAFMMFAGLIVFQAFSECLNKAPKLIVSNPNFVRKVVFPLEILPGVMTIAALAHLLIALVLWVAGYALLFGTPHITLLYLPLLLMAFFPMLLTVGWSLAAVGVFVRDIDQVTGVLARALLFMTPIFYSVDSAPEIIKTAMCANPLAFIIDQFRLILFIGQAPNLIGLLVCFLLATVASAGALYVFRRVRPAFADYV